MKKVISFAIMAMFILSVLPMAFAENTDTGLEATEQSDVKVETPGKTVQITARQKLNADLKEDVRDVREDIKDKKEDIRDISNVDRAKCIERCNLEASKQNIKVDCQAKCKALDSMENRLDTAEDKKDRMEDLREKNRERLAKMANLDQKQIDRLSSLDTKNLEMISQLKKERLDKLSKLSDDKIERLAGLGKADLERITDLSDEDLSKLAVMNKAVLRDLVDKDPTTLRAELKSMKVFKVKNSDDLNERKISDEKLKELRLKFDEAKDRFNKTKGELNELKKQINDAKKEGDESAVLQSAKEYLLKAADAMISHLEKLKVKVQESENIDADTESRIVTEIDVQISDINTIKNEIDAAATKEDVKKAGSKLRDKWNKLKHIARIHAERVVLSRVEGIINNGLVLEKRLEHLLSKIEEKGIEVDVSAEVDLFGQHMADAKDKYSQAKDKIAEAIALKNSNATNDEVRKLADEANSLLKQSRDSVKKAHDVLKDIVKKIKEAEPQANLSEEIEVEVASDSSSTPSESAIGTSTETQAGLSAETTS